MVTGQVLSWLRPRPEQASSDELARAARRGDRDAFEELVRRYQRRVYGLAYQHLSDPEEAQDLAQEVFVRLFRVLDQYDPARPFEPWFWRVAGNVALNYSRRRLVSGTALTDGLAAKAAQGDRLPLELALADLDPGLRLPLLLHYYVGLPLEDVAGALGLTAPAVKSRLHRGRAALRRMLAEEEG
jgi:RNA polymerase sigma-70 factor (ECF subfamily)